MPKILKYVKIIHIIQYYSFVSLGDTLGRRGGLTIKQSRLGWLPFLPTLPGTQASFIVGTFRTAEVADGDPPLGAFGA